MAELGELLLGLMARADGDPADVRVLAPSDEAVNRSLESLGRAVPRPGEVPRAWPSDINECSIALWVATGDVRVLLGADLPAGPAGCGWSALLATLSPSAPASYVEIPHHGAPNAHHDGMWTQLLEADAVAALTTFRGGHAPRPSPAAERRG